MATIHDYARMCKAHRELCITRDCPMSLANNGFDIVCDVLLRKHPSEASAIIDKWCAEHPQKTYLQDFLEKFPNAQVYNSGEPLASACNVYGNVFACEGHLCGECWNAAMPDEAEKEEV